MILPVILLAMASAQAMSIDTFPQSFSNTISNAKVSWSSGKAALCIEGLVSVPVTATNTKLLISEPANQTMVSEFIQENFQANSKLAVETNGGKQTISAKFNIDITLCAPPKYLISLGSRTVQILTHGIGLDKSYWDISPGYSYVDAAANAGYLTLAYNRLGVGGSDHPDPIQTVQAPVDVEILHGLTDMLRDGSFYYKFKNLVGVGHSYGSIVQLAQNSEYPQDVNGSVITGLSNNFQYLPYTNFANNPSIANEIDPDRFGDLSNGYLMHDSRTSVQLPFFRQPYFDPEVFENQFQARDTYTIGQQLTLPEIFLPAGGFHGPVNLVAGQYDFPFCGGDCTFPFNQMDKTKEFLYPAASSGSQTNLVPDAGHFINAHYSAPQHFAQVNKFLAANGF